MWLRCRLVWGRDKVCMTEDLAGSPLVGKLQILFAFFGVHYFGPEWGTVGCYQEVT